MWVRVRAASDQRLGRRMVKDIEAAGGFCAPISDGPLSDKGDDIWPNGIAPLYRRRTLKGRIKNFFAWSTDWGTHMRGGPYPKLRDMLPVFQAQRGGITFSR